MPKGVYVRSKAQCEAISRGKKGKYPVYSPEGLEAKRRSTARNNANPSIQLNQIKGKGHQRWYRLPKLFHKYWIHFKFMHKRVKQRNRECDFPRTPKGFIAFIREIGPIPVDMIKPSVGRIDHSKGYIKGNFRWQACLENSSEGTAVRYG